MTITKQNLVEQIHEKLGYSKKEASELLESTIDIIKNTLASGDDVKVAGFGVFTIKQKADRRGRNPQTGETLIITARRVLSFKSSHLLKKAINRGEE